MNKLPTIKDLTALVKALKPTIMDDYGDGDGLPWMDLTIGADGEGTDSWAYQTGDNSFIGGAYSYPHWAVTTIDRRSNSRDVARDLRGQLEDLLAQSSEYGDVDHG